MTATAALILLYLVGSQASTLSGSLATTGDHPTQIVWVSADEDGVDGSSADCRMSSERWACSGLSATARGVVLLLSADSLQFVVVTPGESPVSSAAKWGRLIRVAAAAVAGDDVSQLQLTAWRPERSAVRPQTRRFNRARDETTEVLPLSSVAFWVTGSESPSDAFLLLEGSTIATHRVALASIAAGPPDSPVTLFAAAPTMLTGRVESALGQGVGDAAVVLQFALAEVDTSRPESLESSLLVRFRTSQTDADGFFAFDHLEDGNYQLLATHSSLGRAEAWTTPARSPTTLRLVPPSTVSGRILRGGLPVPQARVRFVPDSAAWSASTDPTANITDEVSSDERGRFVLALPAIAVGTLQIVAPDGGSLRVPIPPPPKASPPTQLPLGDLNLPAPRAIAVRLVAPECELSAVGPIGSLGLTIVRATSGAGVFWFDLPEAGTWVLNAECRGRTYATTPATIIVPTTGPLPTIDARLID